MTATIAGAAPLYGTWMILRPTIDLSTSPARWFPVPLPDDAKLICPGFDLASAMSSWTERAGTDKVTTRIYGVVAQKAIAAKSFTRSKGTGCKTALIVYAEVAIRSV